MVKTRQIGTGTTRHTRIESNLLNETDVHAMLSDTDAYISPVSKFADWLTAFEEKLAERAGQQRLPTRAHMRVIFDAADRRQWYEASDEEFKEVCRDPGYRASHRYAEPNARKARFYLADESASGPGWGYQSVRWYFGRLMGLAADCRSALEREDWLQLAGRCIELGRLDREFQLKFSARDLVRAYERHAEAGARANETRARKAKEWKEVARTVLSRMPDLRGATASEAARDVLAEWPQNAYKPKERTLRDYFGTLAKGASLPEMKD